MRVIQTKMKLETFFYQCLGTPRRLGCFFEYKVVNARNIEESWFSNMCFLHNTRCWMFCVSKKPMNKIVGLFSLTSQMKSWFCTIVHR